jgi:hypothetical protein
MKKDGIIWWTTSGVICAVMTYPKAASPDQRLSSLLFVKRLLPNYLKRRDRIEAKILTRSEELIPARLRCKRLFCRAFSAGGSFYMRT